MTIAEIKALPKLERLQVMEELWDSLRSEDIESPGWHGDVLKERREAIESGDAKFITLSELKKRIQR